MADPKHAKPGDPVIDASDLDLVDVTPDDIRGFIKFHEGVEKAIACVATLKPEDIKRAGLNPDTVQETVALFVDYERASELYPASAKLTEMLYETKMERAHRVSLNLGELASQGRRRGERDPKGGEILGRLQDLLDYQYGPAIKSAATRAKKAKQAKEAKGAKEAKEAQPVVGAPPAKP